ncbi:MAG: YciI family protein [Hyphomicrobiaceae bacterium]
MLFALILTDKPGGLAIRKETRPAHLDYLRSLGGRVKAAGPFLSEDGSEPRGSLVIIEAATLEEARAVAAADPYAKAGLFATTDIRGWNWVVNPPAAG